MSMNDDIKNILVSEEALKAKVAELGAQISRDYEGRNLSSSPSSRVRWFSWPT